MSCLNGQACLRKVWSLWQKFREVFLHRYLLRMTVTALVLVMFPCCLAFWGVFHYSHQELVQSNVSFYEQSSEMFSQLFMEKLEDVRRHATQISVDSRHPNRPAYKMQKEALLSSPVNYYSVFIKTLMQYEYLDCEWGLYYPSYDVLFGNHLKYSLDRYYADQKIPLSEDEQTALRSFFTDSSVGMRLCPVYDEQGHGSLFVGVSAKMGTDMEPVLFYYRFTSETLDLHPILSPTTQNASFFMIDKPKQQLMYHTGKHTLAPAVLFEQLHTEHKKLNINGVDYMLFSYAESILPYSSVIMLPIDHMNANIFQFYRNMQLVLVGMAVLLLVMLCILVYINYKPMQQTLFVMGLNTYNEWDSIQHIFELMQDEMLEQNQRILDFLLKNLLFGEPLSAKDALRLGLSVKEHNFCVYTMMGTLKTQERLELAQWLKQQRVDVYITDILRQNYTVLICITPFNSPLDELTAKLKEHFALCLPNREVPHAGKLVDDISLIHESYLSCFEEKPEENDPEETITVPDTDARKYASRLVALKEQVEDYIQHNISDCALSQTTVADYFGVSVYSLSRLFKNYIGVGFTDYVNGIRLETARNLLLKTDQSIKDISEAVGMPNNSYFSRLFKLRYEVSPAQFRKNLTVSADHGSTKETESHENETMHTDS